MKIAVIGAGVSGLSCVWRLEQLGFDGQIDLFEKKPEVGDGNVFAEFVAEMFHRPILNIFDYYADEYGLHIEPVQKVYGSVNFGVHSTAQVKGFLGITLTRGNHDLSLVRQLYRKIKTKAILNSHVELQKIRGEYDRIVLATGHLSDLPPDVPVRIDRYCHFLHTVARGEFDPSTVHFHLNHNYAKDGYGYMIPIDHTHAMLSLVTPDRDFDLKAGFERYMAEHWRNHVEIDKLHEIRDFPLGEPDRYTHENLIFVGNTAGGITPAIGYGLHVAILSGIHAADAIALGKDYEELMKHHRREYQWSLALRHALEQLNNEQYDQIIDGMDTIIGSLLLKPGSYNFTRFAGRALSLLMKESKTKYSDCILPMQIRDVDFDQPRHP